MRKTVRLLSTVGPAERLGRAIVTLPPQVQHTLAQVADRDDLPLVAGSWHDDASGCLVANALRCLALGGGATTDHAGVGGEDERVERTLDLRMLDAFPQLSSRDMNHLIVAWDEAAAQAAAETDVELRALLRAGLTWAGVGPAAPSPGGDGDDAAVDAVACRVPTG